MRGESYWEQICL
ncbi:hypothetical protein LINPERHAP2_LOCUS39258 [Linum perenne]